MEDAHANQQSQLFGHLLPGLSQQIGAKTRREDAEMKNPAQANKRPRRAGAGRTKGKQESEVGDLVQLLAKLVLQHEDNLNVHRQDSIHTLLKSAPTIQQASSPSCSRSATNGIRIARSTGAGPPVTSSGHLWPHDRVDEVLLLCAESLQKFHATRKLKEEPEEDAKATKGTYPARASGQTPRQCSAETSGRPAARPHHAKARGLAAALQKQIYSN